LSFTVANALFSSSSRFGHDIYTHLKELPHDFSSNGVERIEGPFCVSARASPEMPELPEVEAAARLARVHCVGKKIVAVTAKEDLSAVLV
jgi:hypothetical protein